MYPNHSGRCACDCHEPWNRLGHVRKFHFKGVLAISFQAFVRILEGGSLFRPAEMTCWLVLEFTNVPGPCRLDPRRGSHTACPPFLFQLCMCYKGVGRAKHVLIDTFDTFCT